MKANNKIIPQIIEKKYFLLIWVVIFMVIHGEMAFNKISWEDDLFFLYERYECGMTSYGRFTIDLIWRLGQKLFGIESLPVVNSLVVACCAVMIGFIAIVICEINNTIARYSIMLISISIPAIASHLGYMTFASVNMFGALLCMISAYYALKFSGVKSAIVSAVLYILSIGVYQCYVTFFLVLILCGLFREILLTDYTVKNVLYRLRRYALICLLGSIAYIVILKWILYLFHWQLADYAGINTYGIAGVSGYWSRIENAYQDFFVLPDSRYNMFPFHWRGWYVILIVLLIIGILLNIANLIISRQMVKCILFLSFVVLIPMVFNFNIIIYGGEALHSLHQYHYIMLAALTILLIIQGRKAFDTCHEGNGLINLKTILVPLVSAYLLLIGFQYVRYDNLCYTMAEVRQQQAISYFTRLISDIYQTEGYRKDIPVCYINEYERALIPTHSIMAYDNVVTIPYATDPAYCYNWKMFMYVWCNYEPEKVIKEGDLPEESLAVIDTMPSYPDDGSIQIVQGVLVVKF